MTKNLLLFLISEAFDTGQRRRFLGFLFVRHMASTRRQMKPEGPFALKSLMWHV